MDFRILTEMDGVNSDTLWIQGHENINLIFESERMAGEIESNITSHGR